MFWLSLPLQVLIREYQAWIVVMAVAFFICRIHATVEAVYLATDFAMIITLELDGGVADVVLFIEHDG